MGGFISFSLEKKLLQIIVVLLILTLAVQFSFRYRDQGEVLFFPRAFLHLLLQEEEVALVMAPSSREYLLIKLINKVVEPGVLLLVNGEVSATFEENPVLIYVADGDLISIDSRDSDTVLWFRVQDVSSEIQSFHPGQQYRIPKTHLQLGEVVISSR